MSAVWDTVGVSQGEGPEGFSPWIWGSEQLPVHSGTAGEIYPVR